ncbi:MAG: hypothetical protein IAF58_18195 [Leptolyngbya sp.]|nr:hypothetical protein [Candidatus Melainabacteria bacterium]
MSTEIQSRFEDSTPNQTSLQKVWSAIAEECSRPFSAFQAKPELKAQAQGDVNIPTLTLTDSESQERKIPPKESFRTDDQPRQDLTEPEKKLGDQLVDAMSKRDTKAIDELIKKYSEWPASLAKSIDYANAHFDQNDKGMAIAFSYYERDSIIKPNKVVPRSGSGAEVGYISYNYAAWDEEPGRKSPVRIFSQKWGGGKIRTSAYSDKADDVNEPVAPILNAPLPKNVP